MKASKNTRAKGRTKFVKVNKSTWIEIDALIPDDVARMQFLEKTQTLQPRTYLGQLKNYISNINT